MSTPPPIPLSIALEYGHVDAAKLLLTHGAVAKHYVGRRSYWAHESSPILLYMEHGGNEADMINMLVHAGDNATYSNWTYLNRNYIPVTPIEAAVVLMKDMKCANNLIATLSKDELEAECRQACKSNNVNIIKALMTHSEVCLGTILYTLVSCKHINTIKWLLTYKNIDLGVLYNKRTTLHYAVMYKRHDMVEMLLEYVMKEYGPARTKQLIDRTDIIPCMHLAAKRNDIKMMDILERYGANINVTVGKRKPQTTLDIATDADKEEAIKWLNIRINNND